MNPVICLIGPTKYASAKTRDKTGLTLYQRIRFKLELGGYIVLTLGIDAMSDTELKDRGLIDDLDIAHFLALHRAKIEIADRVHVINAGGDQMLGDHTKDEIAYARLRKKPVTYEFCQECGGVVTAHCYRCFKALCDECKNSGPNIQGVFQPVCTDHVRLENSK